MRTQRKIGLLLQTDPSIDTPEGRQLHKVGTVASIVRFVTAGTLTEEALLEPRRANVLAAVCEVRRAIGIAAIDISTGRIHQRRMLAAGMGRLMEAVWTGGTVTTMPSECRSPCDPIPIKG